ncbi:protein timeless homolog [Patella vulgata]|uniref:protein timeless homolog n=1 Tax=Patella vulgata TaxID=6465 RepID=UPI00217F3D3A|nr:protein timeless homolog [Patella vulgata]XP_050412860.1 protein timeless homolog [Patella vulgata]
MVMHVELQATCSALGYLEGKKYIKEPDCLETVKDLIRFLKREDETCDIRRQLGHAGILQNDLLQLIKNYKNDAALFDAVLRLLVNLTQPAYLCFNNHIPEDKTLRNYYIEIENHLYNYKEAFVDEVLFAVLTEKIGDILKLDWEQRQEEDKLTLERMLIVLRNVLHIAPDPSMEKRTDDDASLHDQIIWVFHVSGMEDMLLYIASADDERQLCMHLLEIISLMFREQKPEVLANAGVKKSQSEKEREERELESIREQERANKRAEFLKQSTRHSRFGGTYVVKNFKSISDREMIYHKARGDVDNITLNDKKRNTRVSKNRQPIKDTEFTRRSTLSIRLSLKEFCVQFLENCYNPLMFAVKDNLLREKTQEHDETYYMWSVRFFMEFCRFHSKRVDLISETMSTNTYHYIYTNLINYYEMMLTEKKEAKVWGRRAHLALKAYQELMLTLDSMDRSGNSHFIESAKVIKSNVFYLTEYRDIFVTLLRKFNESQMSRTYLKDLVESTHLFLKMLETWSKKGSVVVQKKKKHKSKKPKEKPGSAASGPSEQELEDMWDEISGELSEIVQNRKEIPTDITPFDAASEVDVDQQRAETMIRIQDTLREKKMGEAVALFRAAREVWPERDEFGAVDVSPEDEFMLVREIFLAPLPRQTVESENNIFEEDETFNEVEEEEMEFTEKSEQQFNFQQYMNTFAKSAILKSYGLLLADYKTNTTHTNHCIIKMFHRVSVDLGCVGMLFQASIFRTFQQLMFGPCVKLPRYKEMVKFGTYLVEHFVKAAQDNPKIFMELLFWKSSSEAMDITHGYGYTANNRTKVLWTEEQEQEVGRLYEESAANIEDNEKDIADRIMERLTDPTKTRNQLIRQLKRQGLIDSAAELRSKKTGVNVWREEHELELKTLFERYKDSDDPLGNIASSMYRSKNKVANKLIELGLINDRKDIDKKRTKKNKSHVVWREEEEFELRNLFEEYQDGGNTLHNIMSRISGKSKSNVIDKLLELELIKDRSEVDKRKPTKKKKTNKDIWGAEQEDEVLPDFSSSDEETRARRLDSTRNMLENINSNDEKTSDSESSSSDDSDMDDNGVDMASGSEGSTNMHKDETIRRTAYTQGLNLTEVIKDIVSSGYKEQITWIQRALQKTANNREKNNSGVSIPIVPLTEDNETAMEDEKFLDFMKMIGISPPANEQEAFWRISGELSVSELRNIIDGLTLNDQDEPINADKIQVKQISSMKKKKQAKEKKEVRKNKKDAEKEKKENNKQAERKKIMMSKLEALKALKESRKRKRTDENNESSSDEEIENKFNKPKSRISPKGTKKTRKIQRVMDLDSESDDASEKDRSPVKQVQMESDGNSSSDEPLTKSTKSQSFPATMLSQVVDSDSDVDDHIPLRKVLKKNIISSDED